MVVHRLAFKRAFRSFLRSLRLASRVHALQQKIVLRHLRRLNDDLKSKDLRLKSFIRQYFDKLALNQKFSALSNLFLRLKMKRQFLKMKN